MLFFSRKGNFGLILNVDWFQPFKHRTYSVGVIFLAILNLPRNMRYKRENIILLGLIPGPREPSKTINTYLGPLVSDLLKLWSGLRLSIAGGGTMNVRCALLCVACDIPAGRKVCGFLSHSANLGCPRCYCNFATGDALRRDYSGFDRSSWTYRSNTRHKADVQTILECS